MVATGARDGPFLRSPRIRKGDRCPASRHRMPCFEILRRTWLARLEDSIVRVPCRRRRLRARLFGQGKRKTQAAASACKEPNAGSATDQESAGRKERRCWDCRLHGGPRFVRSALRLPLDPCLIANLGRVPAPVKRSVAPVAKKGPASGRRFVKNRISRLWGHFAGEVPRSRTWSSRSTRSRGDRNP